MRDVQGSRTRAAPPVLFQRCLDLRGRAPAQMYPILHQYQLIPVHCSRAPDRWMLSCFGRDSDEQASPHGVLTVHDLGAGLLTTSPCIQGLPLFLGFGFTKTLSPIANSLSCFDARLS